MATKNLIPRADGEGGIGINGQAWGSGNFKSDLTLGGNTVLTGYIVTESDVTGHQAALSITESQISDLQTYLTDYTVTESDVTSHQTALSITESQISDLQNYLTSYTETNDLSAAVTWANVPDANITSSSVLQHSGSLKIDSSQIGTFDSDLGGTQTSNVFIKDASISTDPNDSTSIYFPQTPKSTDALGNTVPVLTADRLGLSTADVLDVDPGVDVTFKLLGDEKRFVVGTTGEYGLEGGWYRFNDFNVKGATDIGAYPLNPVDTRIYSDESSFILFTTDTAGNRVAHLVGGEEEVSANNAIALGLAVKVDANDTPSDIEFVHTDGEQYSVINGDSDSLGTNGLPIRQGFQNASLGANPSPLLIDGGYF